MEVRRTNFLALSERKVSANSNSASASSFPARTLASIRSQSALSTARLNRYFLGIRRASRSGTPFPIVISTPEAPDITIGNGVPDLLARLMQVRHPIPNRNIRCLRRGYYDWEWGAGPAGASGTPFPIVISTPEAPAFTRMRMG